LFAIRFPIPDEKIDLETRTENKMQELKSLAGSRNVEIFS